MSPRSPCITPVPKDFTSGLVRAIVIGQNRIQNHVKDPRWSSPAKIPTALTR